MNLLHLPIAAIVILVVAGGVARVVSSKNDNDHSKE